MNKDQQPILIPLLAKAERIKALIPKDAHLRIDFTGKPETRKIAAIRAFVESKRGTVVEIKAV